MIFRSFESKKAKDQGLWLGISWCKF